jgi:VanZ family protein
MAGIFLLSAQSNPPFFDMIDGKDFLLHLIQYSVFGLLLSRALLYSGKARFVLFATTIGFMYGISDELHQYFVPGRTSSLLDVTADGLGSFLGSYLFYSARPVKQNFLGL